jgi:RNA polymerase sigma factor (sigma-70 family)
LPLEDIVQEGNVDLLKAAARFDPDRGCRLATYAAYWIRAEIRDYVVRDYRIVRLGSSKSERRAMRLYRRTRENLREGMAQLNRNGMKRVALYGVGEAAELAYLTLREFGLEPVGIFAREAGGQFLGFPVRSVTELVEEDFDGVVVATFERPEQHAAELERLGVPREKFLTLRRLASPAPSTNGGEERA